MERTWQVHRDTIVHPDGQRRWDRAYQLLLSWADEHSVAQHVRMIRRTTMRIALYVRVSTSH